MQAIKIKSLARPIRNLKNYTSINLINSRQNSTNSNKLVLLKVNDKTGIATVTLNSKPVNSLNLELLSSFSKTLDELKANNTRGMILTSSGETVFSAGLDINEMYKPDMKRVRDFWRALQDCWIKLYGTSYPTACAINGHAPAGGCLFAMSCEYRVMLPKYTIGLNETKLGIVAPSWFMATMRNTISNRQAEMALTLGTLFTTEEALKIGLVDEIAKNKEEAIERCEAFLHKYAKIPADARAFTKNQCRYNDIKELELNRDADVELFATFIVNDQMQKSLGQYIMFLKWKKRLKPLIEFGKYLQSFLKPKKNKK